MESPVVAVGGLPACVIAAGYDPDSFILVYRHGSVAENGVGSRYVRVAKEVSRRVGLRLYPVDGGVYSDREKMLMGCFGIDYSGSFGTRMVCAGNCMVRGIYGG
ncbi:MAG: hypothetical protein V1875_00475 [Candidatus Altiarchaeota archaeon]